VQITYDVEIGDAVQQKELPFVVGVMADLSGKRAAALPAFKARKFVEIDRDNFTDVMEAAAPRTTFQVDNELTKDGSKLNVELSFRGLEDFEPGNIVAQVPALRRLMEARNRLRDLLTKMDGNDELEAQLMRVIGSSDDRSKLKAEVEAARPALTHAPTDGASDGEAATAAASESKPKGKR
jgi:type VI secretion system protein ImpB